MRPFNLLNHPGLAQQRRVFHRWWTSLAGLLVGSLLAWAGHQWQIAETLRLQKAHNALQLASLARSQQTQEAARQQKQQRVLLAQAAHLQQIASHQQAWMAVHEHLQAMAERGLRLSRLKSEAGHVALHGELNRFETMAAVQQSLSERWGQDLTLQEATTGPESQVSFVWETTWPALHSGPLAPAAVIGKTQP